jgi:hypothetical protein
MTTWSYDVWEVRVMIDGTGTVSVAGADRKFRVFS